MEKCLFCQEPLPPYATYKQKYCNEAHRWRMNNLKRKGLSLEEIQKIAQEEIKGVCNFCQKVIEPNKKFCSSEHSALFYYYQNKGLNQQEIFDVAKDIESRNECLLCGTPLNNKGGKAQFCCKNHYSFFYYHKTKGLTLNTIRSIFKEKNK